MTERTFLVWVNLGEKNHYKYRWHNFMGRGLGINEKEREAKDKH